MDIFLIGPRGCGKTTVGRALALRLGQDFVDLDDLVLGEFAETSIRDVFAKQGEAAWREAEERVLMNALGEGEQRVIALGGGTPMIPGARRFIEDAQLRMQVRVVYLQCSVEELAKRLGRDAGDRPSLSGQPVEEEVGEILVAREPVYVGLADFVVNADAPSAEGMAEQLEAWLSSAGEAGD